MYRLILTFGFILLFYSLGFTTVNIAIKTSEYVVFASESRITYNQGTLKGAIANDSYEKIVRVSKFVMAQMGGTAWTSNKKNFKTMIQEFRWRYNIDDSSTLYLDSILTLFVKYCNVQRSSGTDYEEMYINFAGLDNTGALSYCVYSPANDELPSYKNNDIYCKGAIGANSVFRRIFFGIDGKMKTEIMDLVSERSTDKTRDSLINKLGLLIEEYKIMKTPIEHLSLQDAIDCAYMLVKTTTVVDRLSHGRYKSDKEAINPKTGGRILVCVVTRDGVEWIKAPKYKINK